MIREHFHNSRRAHRRTILAIGLFVLFFAAIAVAGLLGMAPIGIGILAVLFVVGGFLMEAVFDHY